MLPLREPIAGPVGWPFVLGGKRPMPGGFPPVAGGGFFCAHTIWKEMAIAIANPATLRIRVLFAMGAPPFVSHIIHVGHALCRGRPLGPPRLVPALGHLSTPRPTLPPPSPPLT